MSNYPDDFDKEKEHLKQMGQQGYDIKKVFLEQQEEQQPKSEPEKIKRRFDPIIISAFFSIVLGGAMLYSLIVLGNLFFETYVLEPNISSPFGAIIDILPSVYYTLAVLLSFNIILATFDSFGIRRRRYR